MTRRRSTLRRSTVRRSTLRRSLCASLCAASVAAGCTASKPDSGPPMPAPVTAPVALTPTEFNNTVRDLLGFTSDAAAWPPPPAIAATLSPPRYAYNVFSGRTLRPPWPWRFPQEPGAEGFEGIAEGQASSPYQIEEVQAAAMHFASFALVSPVFFTCPQWSELADDRKQACALSSLEKFAQRAYRRPIDPAEKQRLQALWQANLAEGTAEEAVALTVAGILQSPHFLFKIERDAPGESATQVASLSNWELATRLSYFLWDSMPDPELFRAASAGELSAPEGIARQARRMLNDPRARRMVVRFHHQWLETDQVVRIAPSRAAFGPVFGVSASTPLDTTGDAVWPGILGPVRHSMLYELELFVERVLFDGDGTFTALLTDSGGFMSDATRPIHGPNAERIEDGPTHTRRFTFVSASTTRSQQLNLYAARFSPAERAGILTQPAVLAVGSYAVQPGPILRGKRVLERVACMELGAPIPGAEAALPPDTLTAQRTNRQRTTLATAPPQCDACHVTLNPPGFAFEHYDALGRWRAEDNGEPVDASGNFTLEGGEALRFDDAPQLVAQLAASRRVRDCYVTRWTRYAIGHQLDFHAPQLEALKAGFADDDTVTELLVAITTSDLFRLRRQGGTP